mgnify:CR=1 FL=1
MMPFLDAESALHMHTKTVARVNRDGYKLAYREEDARLRRRDAAAAQPVRHGRGVALLQGLRRLRFA